ncbi:MAG TPA: alanine racemase [Candidatus Corynebacterium gallistercoris]|uniref:Alanine racemase n=1 Tax=Candidatus Corynebacterium gallistercoris TaxID=2838530 RepID=A0A9D1RZU1_9CORY|nr:alanine racemase [Candidatus Corynebacterium gallistercoris]
MNSGIHPTAPESGYSPHTPQALAELTIDLSAIRHNVETFVRAAAPAKVMAVVKADAYNHGVEPVINAVLEAGAAQIGVATVGEALAVRSLPNCADVPLAAWMWFPGEDLTAAVERNIAVGIPSLAHARALVQHATGSAGGGPISAMLMVDTGLSRSGVSPAEWEETVQLLAANTDVVAVTGLMSHLSSADDVVGGDAPTTTQAERFQRAIDYCREQGLQVPVNHLANTPATLTRPDTHHEMVRPGVGIYGMDPVAQKTGADLRPAMTLRARVLTTRVVPAGEGVSYGLTWRAQEDTRTAVVAIGYADGIPRSASGNFAVTINGHSFPQVGRVCMDQIVVALGPADQPTPVPVEPGDWAIIFGEGGASADEFAAAAGTISYEILTLPRGPRVARRFIGAEEQVASVDLSAAGGTVVAKDAEQMRQLGRQIGEQVNAGTVVVLTGPLGAGKTTLTQGIAEGLGVRGRVQSPTFTIVRTHKPGQPGGPGMLHMDAYRLFGGRVAESVAPGESMGRDEVLDLLESLDIDADLDRAVVVAEWGQGVVEALSDSVVDVVIERSDAGDEHRTVTWAWNGRKN